MTNIDLEIVLLYSVIYAVFTQYYLEIVLLCAVIYAVFMKYIIKPIWKKLKGKKNE